MTAADAGSMRGSEATSPSNLLLNNLPLITAFLAFAIAQFLKLFTNWFKERRWDSKRMIDSGGMPSSHSATVTALAVAIGLQDGTGGPAFAIAVVLACVRDRDRHPSLWNLSLLLAWNVSDEKVTRGNSSFHFSFLSFLFPLISSMTIGLYHLLRLLPACPSTMISVVFSHFSRESSLTSSFLPMINSVLAILRIGFFNWFE
ncbi:uncharacterized protein LOC111314556 isoform X2 [Durio zibethinus]|uniref:Uncharacterized protein LOC111314556 isoform X2 n=1 Tax=Durio zibethinus TaxID=66656 RepID=A0A6P6B3I1_DURZI|nr:uncharacterized protein LOC111314556 isoform X2 [Durio zibethinus]